MTTRLWALGLNRDGDVLFNVAEDEERLIQWPDEDWLFVTIERAEDATSAVSMARKARQGWIDDGKWPKENDLLRARIAELEMDLRETSYASPRITIEGEDG